MRRKYADQEETSLKFKTPLAALLALLAALPAIAGSDSVVIRGTASMLHLCQGLITLSRSDLSGTEVGVNVADSTESLPAGGNSIWQSVHRLDKTQKQQLEQRFGSAAHEVPIAIEGVVVIVNKTNSVAELTVDQLRAIYTGKATNWKQVGAGYGAIHLYSSEVTVGGSLFFTDLVLHGEDIDTTMRAFSNPKETERAVAQDPQGIGLIPLTADNDVKYPRIGRSAMFPGVEASSENIRTLKYPLSSYVYWDFAEQHSGAITRLVQWVLSPRGQLAVEGAGYYPLNPSDRTHAAAEILTAKR